LPEANQQWIKSLDMSVTPEDIFTMSYQIAKCAYQSGQDYLMKRFSQDALAKDTGKNQELTAIVQILDGLSYFQKDGNSGQMSILKLIEIVMPNDTNDNFEKHVLSEITTANDLAYYICLAALTSCHRKELRETVLQSANFVMLTSPINDTAFIIEHYLNGNYKQFQNCLDDI
jgi:hypothetical protein